MFFLLRMAFWLTVICLFLPGSRDENIRLLSSAQQTVNDMRGFCQRNPKVCEDMRQSMTTLLTRFRSGAELLQGWLAQQSDASGENETPAEKDTIQDGRGWHSEATPLLMPQPVTKWQNSSLNLSDRQVPWRGPGSF